MIPPAPSSSEASVSRPPANPPTRAATRNAFSGHRPATRTASTPRPASLRVTDTASDPELTTATGQPAGISLSSSRTAKVASEIMDRSIPLSRRARRANSRTS